MMASGRPAAQLAMMISMRQLDHVRQTQVGRALLLAHPGARVQIAHAIAVHFTKAYSRAIYMLYMTVWIITARQLRLGRLQVQRVNLKRVPLGTYPNPNRWMAWMAWGPSRPWMVWGPSRPSSPLMSVMLVALPVLPRTLINY